MMQSFTVYGQPVAKGRPRLGANGHTYTPEKTREAEHMIQRCASLAHLKPMHDPVVVEINFYFSIPKSWSKRAKEEARLMHVLPAHKPDIDNCIKLVLDALNKLAWDDDTQVVGVVARKYYADVPRTFICIEEVTP